MVVEYEDVHSSRLLSTDGLCPADRTTTGTRVLYYNRHDEFEGCVAFHIQLCLKGRSKLAEELLLVRNLY